jgi:hypothetical protein
MSTQGKIEAYDPWKNTWTDVKKVEGSFTLPDFKRSIVIRLRSK